MPAGLLQAGIIASIFGGEVEAETNNRNIVSLITNSQNVGLQSAGLLFAGFSTNSKRDTGVGGLLEAGNDNSNIVNGSALLAEVGPLGTMADIQEIPSHGKISTYTVRGGDTLAEIAEMFDVTVNTVAWANNLSIRSPITEGQTLVILPVTGVRHKVTKGETIQKIADKYKGSVTEIINYNGLEGEKLVVGEVIIIPDGELVVVATQSTNTSSGTVSSRDYRSKAGPTPLIRGTDQGPSYNAYYIRPVVNATKTQGLHGYNGVDLAAPIGTPIRAAAAGTVIVSKIGGWHGGYGNYLVISHPNGTQTLYAHNSQNLVSIGQQVAQGETIALMGSTGNSTGPHLHFEVRGAKNPF